MEFEIFQTIESSSGGPCSQILCEDEGCTERCNRWQEPTSAFESGVRMEHFYIWI